MFLLRFRTAERRGRGRGRERVRWLASGGRGGSSWGPGKLATRTSAKPQSPTSPHARPSVIKLQMSHRERTNPRGHDRRTDSAALLEGIRGDGRPARQDPLRDGGEDHDTYMMRENGLPPVAMKERRRERGGKRRKRERRQGGRGVRPPGQNQNTFPWRHVVSVANRAGPSSSGRPRVATFSSSRTCFRVPAFQRLRDRSRHSVDNGPRLQTVPRTLTRVARLHALNACV